MNHRQEFKVFSGNANPSLAAEITRFLHINMGKSEVSKFANGETSVIIHESIRSQDVYIVQPTCSNLNQINFIKHAKANSNSNLNTSIRSSPQGPLVRAPSYNSLIRTSSGSINTLPLGLANSLSNKEGDNTGRGCRLWISNIKAYLGFFNPELGPLKSDGKPVPNLSIPNPSQSPNDAKVNLPSTPSTPFNPSPSSSQPTVPVTPQSQSTSTPTTPTAQTTPTSAKPPLPTPPSTPLSQVSSTPSLPQTTPTNKQAPLKSPRSMPTSPSCEREKLVISHSSSKDIDRYNWSSNDSLMELLVMGDAFKRASCSQLIAVIPFFGYARQSKKHKSRTPITAKLVANMLQTAGFNRVITVDLHASQIQGFFDIPVDNLYAESLIVKYIRKRISGDKIVVSPGAGGVKRAKSVADKLGLDLAILHKEINHENHVKQMVLVGDVKDKVALIIDDIADTCETLERATYTLIEKGGATKVYALVTHGVLSDRAIERIISMPLTELVITNSIPNDYNLSQCSKIKVVNIGPLLGEAIRRTNFGESLSTYFFS